MDEKRHELLAVSKTINSEAQSRECGEDQRGEC
jgi:hypothetical protein